MSQTNKNDSDAILVRSVSTLRGDAAGILIAAQMGTKTTIHPRIGTLGQRLEYIATTAQKIMDDAKKLYPNQPVLTPAQGLKWLTCIHDWSTHGLIDTCTKCGEERA